MSLSAVSSSSASASSLSLALRSVLVPEFGRLEALFARLASFLLAQLVDGVLVDGFLDLADGTLECRDVHFTGSQTDHAFALTLFEESLDLGEVSQSFGLFAS